MSNVVEGLVCHQLVADLEQNGLLRELGSIYRRGRSTETAVVKVSRLLLIFSRLRIVVTFHVPAY